MGILFGTDGVRGIANKDLTCELAYKVGKAGAYALTIEKNHNPYILVGTDTRISCDMLCSALTSGILSVGGNVIMLGVVPTPAVAYLVRKYKADAGVMISASHNPMEYNGIKFFDSNGHKLKDQLEADIEKLILEDLLDTLPCPAGENIGRIEQRQQGIEDYIDYAISTVDCDLSGIKISVDCANGATYACAKKVFDKLGIISNIYFNSPDGTNINKDCGSTHIKRLLEYTKMDVSDIGFAFDGDGDRVLASDENGCLIDGDKIMAILSKQLKAEGRLNNNTLVATVMSNMGLFMMADKHGITVDKTKVGDRYVLEEMLKHSHSIGGEQSGHIILLEYNTTGDGIITALQLMCSMKKSNRPSSNMADIMKYLPQVLINIKVNSNTKAAILQDEDVLSVQAEADKILSGKGRTLLRISGTEPVVRVMVEGEDEALINEWAGKMADAVRKKYA